METKTPEGSNWSDLQEQILQLKCEVAAFNDQNQKLRSENHQIQHDYESLRIQKGGFGFKMLLLSGFGGFLTGAVLIYLFLHPRDTRALAFERFKTENLFNIERAISEGDFEKAETILKDGYYLPENKTIQPEIDFARKITGAARRKCH